MKPIAKVAIGCAVVLLLGGAAAVALLVGGAYWVKGKVGDVTSREERIDQLKKRAGASAPFTRPADDVVQEARLLKFLEIRKRMASIYEQHRAEIDRVNKREKTDLRDAWNALGWINELRLAHAEALADVGMGEDEYRFLVEQVYKSAWAAAAGASASPPADVPKQNLELFKKHEPEIKQYAMNRLEMLGL